MYLIVTSDFKGNHYLKNMIVYAVFFNVRYAVEYRDLAKITVERGFDADHATLNLSVLNFPLNGDGSAQTKAASS